MKSSMLIGILTLAIALSGCALFRETPSSEVHWAPDPGLDRLTTWMTGSFTSAAQAAADSSYYEIELEMAPIWTELSGARWLYVEQAVATHKAAPYRQRVYRLTRLDENLFESAVYKLPDEEKYVGAYLDPERLDAISPAFLIERQGCSIVLELMADGTYGGSTQGTGCESTLRGATYATSHVTLRADRLMSWDRGYDAGGNQVWGARDAGYVFERK